MAVSYTHLDVYKRQRPDIILDLLMRHHNVDIQWGNHDVVWMLSLIHISIGQN